MNTERIHRRLNRSVRWLGIAAVVAAVAGVGQGSERSWIRLDLPDFTVISAASPEATRNWAVEFEQFHRGMKPVLNFNDRFLQPVTVVLFGSQRELDPYKPLEKGKPANVAGYFTPTPLANYIAVADNDEDDWTRQIIFHEGVHWLTHVTDEPVTPWLDEGLAEVFSTFRVEGDRYEYGDALPRHVRELHGRQFIPLKELLQIHQGSLLYNEGDRAGIFYAESWGFVHYLLFSGHRELVPKYNELIKELQPGQDPDQVFLKVFGVDCAGMEKRLTAYLSYGKYSRLSLKFDRGAIESEIKIRPASAPEVEVAKASLLVATGRSDEALPRLKRAAAALPGNRDAQEALGLAEFETADYDEAARYFRTAADQKSPHAFVYSVLGDDALGVRPGIMSPATPKDQDALRLAVDYYEHDLRLDPRDQHAYENMATVMYQMDPVRSAETIFLRHGGMLYPDDARIKLGLAVLELKQGTKTEGLARLRALAAGSYPGYGEVPDFADKILADQTRGEIASKANALFAEQKFAEAIAVIDEFLATNPPPQMREEWLLLRGRADAAQQMQRIVELANDGEADQCLPLVQTLLKLGQLDDSMRRQLLAWQEKFQQEADKKTESRLLSRVVMLLSQNKFTEANAAMDELLKLPLDPAQRERIERLKAKAGAEPH